ncbi:MAG: hypothetical protein C0597_14010 [Marinilabiliales bacterium]|nr:MAG: hypothetical protein C0597_14010 [Marinilabiliales bacterium]
MKVEGNHYFPIESINKDLLDASELQTTCVWKGVAHYYHLKIDDEQFKDMVWYYTEPKDAAKEIKGRIAFYQKDGVDVIEE